MASETFYLELVIRCVTCPGVWLCHKGCVSLTVELFGSKLRTKPVPPMFPLCFNTKFTFTKDLGNINDNSELQKAFENDQLHCKLLQWPKKPFEGKPRILATYIGVAEDLIFSPEIYTDAKVDLLMKSAPIFPGIIAPKIETERRMTVNGSSDIEETFVTDYETIYNRRYYDRNLEDIDNSQCEQYCKIDSNRKEDFWIVNLGHMSRQRTVCHLPNVVKCGDIAKEG